MKKITNLELVKFFRCDKLNLKKYPNAEASAFFSIRSKFYMFDLREIPSANSKKEIKVIIQNLMEPAFIKKQGLINNYIKPLVYLVLLLNQSDVTSIMNLEPDSLKNLMELDGVKIDRNNQYALQRFQNLLVEDSEFGKGIYKNKVSYKDLNLSASRINETTTQDTMDFLSILHPENREALRTYMIYLVGITSKAYNTMVQEFRIIRKFLNYFDKKELNDLTMDDITSYLLFLESKRQNVLKLNTTIQIIDSFLSVLFAKEILKTSFSLQTHKKKASYPKKLNRVDHYALQQIFKNLSKMDSNLRLMYLIIFCTGCRVSEVCEMTMACLRKDTLNGEENYFITYTSEKMNDKTCWNKIAKELYILIEQYIENLKNQGIIRKFLFPSVRNPDLPYQTATFSTAMNTYMKSWNIKNQDGSAYIYRPHSYRHELASYMVDQDTPFFVIQDYLQHYSPEMTTAYAEVSRERLKQKHLQFISCNGNLDPSSQSHDHIYKDAELLSNGLCIHPYHNCIQLNACLSCSYFRTTKDHLEQHKHYLEDLKMKLKYYEANNFLPQAETAKITISNLQKIIDKMEEEK